MIKARSVATSNSFDGKVWSGQLIHVAGVPAWESRGPGPYTGGSTTSIPDSPVSGAIHRIALHPFDLSSMYVGTANGGVWRNSDISVLFEFDSSTLTNTAKARLDTFADFLKKNMTLTVSVVGHTDDTGDNETVNVPLSEDRAAAVKTYLVSKGIDVTRLTDRGEGELMPIASNATPAGQTLNRRVELIVNHWVPLTDQFPSLAISALTVSPRDADGLVVSAATPSDKLVIYAGTGAVTSRRVAVFWHRAGQHHRHSQVDRRREDLDVARFNSGQD